jgi:16S rRNA (cytidine1402-2'-O)-methyltransferase
MSASGKLYLVPTPIGNLKDITLRALETLQLVDLVVAEDTRVTSKLLKHYNIDKPLSSFHLHNEHDKVNVMIEKLLSGKLLALASDAGTPAISDPGFLLVRACIENKIEVECLPGATAFVPALVNSGLPSDKFCFEGFLPQKKGRQTRLTFLAAETRTILFYESPHRLVKTLGQLSTFFGPQRKASISREISKMFEETKRGTISDLHDYYIANPPKGEIVIVVAGKSQ